MSGIQDFEEGDVSSAAIHCDPGQNRIVEFASWSEPSRRGGDKMKFCPICETEEDDGRAYRQETYCKKCLASDVATLRFIHLRSLAGKKASPDPEKDTREA
jgi:hypothetical protein